MAESQERMTSVELTPAASSILSLVAQDPSVPEETVDRLINRLDKDLQELVRAAVAIVRTTARQEAPAFDATSTASVIAQAYVTWAQQNARYQRTKSLAL